MDSWLRWILPAFFILYFAAAFVWPMWRTWKRTGINPYALGRSDNAHDFIGVLFRLLFGACVGVVLLYSFYPPGYAYLTPIPWLLRPGIVYAGIALLAVSLVWMVAAQATLGASWRIGIDILNRTELVHGGVYRFSRNPIFLGMRITLLGLFLVLPNAVTFAVLIAGDAVLHIQVRLEEEFLGGVHVEKYEEYVRNTRRWL